MNDEVETTSQGLGKKSESHPELPPADFDFLVYSLRLQAELNLGLRPLDMPAEENAAPDFELARHYIDLLSVLQEKTKGNLTLDEQRALDNSITELRLDFVRAQTSVQAQTSSR